MTDLRRFADSLLTDLMKQIPLDERPVLLWKNLRVSAGIAYYHLHQIGLSKMLLTDEERVKDTLIHEYAHLLAVQRQGRKAANHGKHWKQAMLELGADPQVRHRYEVERNSRRQEISYECLRCGAIFMRSRRLPVRRKYLHIACGGAIRLRSVAYTTEP